MFNTSDFPKIDAFQVLNPKSIPINLNQDYGMEDFDLIFSFYGYNKINLFQGERNEAASIIKCTKEVFESHATEYFKSISKEKAYEGETSKKVNTLKEKLKENSNNDQSDNTLYLIKTKLFNKRHLLMKFFYNLNPLIKKPQVDNIINTTGGEKQLREKLRLMHIGREK